MEFNKVELKYIVIFVLNCKDSILTKVGTTYECIVAPNVLLHNTSKPIKLSYHLFSEANGFLTTLPRILLLSSSLNRSDSTVWYLSITVLMNHLGSGSSAECSTDKEYYVYIRTQFGEYPRKAAHQAPNINFCMVAEILHFLEIDIICDIFAFIKKILILQ
jgi:hypothetical protein